MANTSELIDQTQLKKDFISHQNINKKPVVELYIGDVVELRNDGIYFTRKIQLFNHDNKRESVFNNIKESCG